MPDSPNALAAERYYLMVEQAGADIDLLRCAIEFGIRNAGMSLTHPHIRAMLAYCAVYEAAGPAENVTAGEARCGNLTKTVSADLH